MNLELLVEISLLQNIWQLVPVFFSGADYLDIH